MCFLQYVYYSLLYLTLVTIVICGNRVTKYRNLRIYSVSSEDISCVDLVLDIVKTGGVAVGYDGMALLLELCDVVDNLASEECAAVFKGRLVDDDFRPFRLDTLHHALD